MRIMPIAIALALLGVCSLWAQEPIEAPPDVVWERDIEYSNVGGRMELDVVRPREGVGPFAAGQPC
jgi:hypothetical protein